MPKKLTKEEFVKRSNDAHNNKFDYSKVEYINTATKVCIICPIHGEFWQFPRDHMNGRSCRKCSGTSPLTIDEFIEKSRKVHGDKYDYSKSVINGSNKTKIKIICPVHGEFEQRINDHLNGYGCKKCGGNERLTTEQFIERAKIVHGDKYDYSKAEYKSSTSRICIICPKHGEFKQIPRNHLFLGAGCPQCNNNRKSKMEEGVYNKLIEYGFAVERQKTFDWLKHKGHLFLDFFLPEYNIAIEVMGEQHFVPIGMFGGQKFLDEQHVRDNEKLLKCKENGIKMFYITKRNYSINEIIGYINNEASNKVATSS